VIHLRCQVSCCIREDVVRLSEQFEYEREVYPCRVTGGFTGDLAAWRRHGPFISAEANVRATNCLHMFQGSVLPQLAQDGVLDTMTALRHVGLA
jgi:hypothetical protein